MQLCDRFRDPGGGATGPQGSVPLPGVAAAAGRSTLSASVITGGRSGLLCVSDSAVRRNCLAWPTNLGLGVPSNWRDRRHVLSCVESKVILAPSPGAPSVGRALVDDVCGGVPGSVRDVVKLVVSELVTNALVHGDPEITLLVRCDDKGVRVEVSDASPDPPTATRARTEESGRGLLIVEALTSSWGYTSHRGRVRPAGTTSNAGSAGKVVWCNVDLSP